MKIGIDATGLFGPRTGIEQYMIKIVNGLLEIDRKNTYTVYFRDAVPGEIQDGPPNAEFKVVRFLNRKVFQQTRLPWMNRRDQNDLLFYPGNTLSLINSTPAVITIHDIFPFVVQDYAPKYHRHTRIGRINNLYWKWMSRTGCQRADRVIAVSESTKRDLVRVFSVSNHKIDVVHHGVGEEYRTTGKGPWLGNFRKRHGLVQPYILCVGTGVYKNLEGSIRAFKKLKQGVCSSMKLVVTGPKTRIGDGVFALVEETGLAQDIVLTDYFPQEDMVGLYQAAELLLFPSYYEGFGFPVLEAFSCGVPVVTSNVSSLPEVAGDGALMVDPYDPKAMARSIEKVLRDSALRAELVAKGYEQVKRFSWKAAAQKTLYVLEKTGQP